MELTNVTLNNLKCLENTELNLNGTTIFTSYADYRGKTTILEAIGTALGWVTVKRQSPNSRGRKLPDDWITVRKDRGSVEVTVNHHETDYKWQITDGSGDYKGVIDLAAYLEDEQPDSMPVIVLYKEDRAFSACPWCCSRVREYNMLACNDDNPTSNFDCFFEWFENTENLENEWFRKGIWSEDKSKLKRVMGAVKKVVPSVYSLQLNREAGYYLEAIVGKQSLWFKDLAICDQYLVALVGDIARRLIIANQDNPALSNPLEGEGIVLIDEIELHLPITKQYTIVGDLQALFPNVQFIISTNSPFILSSVHKDNVRVIYGDTIEEPDEQTQGVEVGSIIPCILGLPPYPDQDENVQRLQQYAHMEAMGDADCEEGRELYNELKEHFGATYPPLERIEIHKRFVANRKKDMGGVE